MIQWTAQSGSLSREGSEATNEQAWRSATAAAVQLAGDTVEALAGRRTGELPAVELRVGDEQGRLYAGLDDSGRFDLAATHAAAEILALSPVPDAP